MTIFSRKYSRWGKDIAQLCTEGQNLDTSLKFLSSGLNTLMSLNLNTLHTGLKKHSNFTENGGLHCIVLSVMLPFSANLQTVAINSSNLQITYNQPVFPHKTAFACCWRKRNAFSVCYCSRDRGFSKLRNYLSGALSLCSFYLIRWKELPFICMFNYKVHSSYQSVKKN